MIWPTWNKFKFVKKNSCIRPFKLDSKSYFIRMIELTGDIISLAWYDARPPLIVTEVQLKSTIQNSIGKRKLEKEAQNNESTWMHKSQKASLCCISASLQICKGTGPKLIIRYGEEIRQSYLEIIYFQKLEVISQKLDRNWSEISQKLVRNWS